VAAYYNEFDPFAAAWLRELIKDGFIADGEVDERSIKEVTGADVAGFIQCHFFAGIGGWSLALRLAGWDDARPVWTGSCPCQPFSNAGQRKGEADHRHLWPDFRRLISECAPPVVFGEQVASADGRKWLAGVQADLEALAYANAAADLCAAGVGAPHIRQRLYWVAHPDLSEQHGRQSSVGQQSVHVENSIAPERLGVPEGKQHDRRGAAWNWRDELADAGSVIDCADGYRRIEPGACPLAHGLPRRMDKIRGYGNAIVPQAAAEFIQAFCET
jgi:DNA (cytosine-5)-methyltransferase 1